MRFARIGDAVYHKWTCDAQVANVFCMRVHSCTVSDGQGGPPIQILDSDGCSIDRFVLADLDYVTDLMAGQEAHVFKVESCEQNFKNFYYSSPIVQRSISTVKLKYALRNQAHNA